jgi:hypothetical protein
MFGCDMPLMLNHEGDEGNSPSGKPSVTIEKYRGPAPDTFITGDRSLIGYVVDSDFGSETVVAVEDIPAVYRRELAAARRNWAKFAAWVARQGVVLDAPRFYFTPSEQ